MGTLSQALKHDLLSTIIRRYELGASESTEESSVYVLPSKALRDQKIQVKAFQSNIQTYVDIQNVEETLAASKDTSAPEVLSGKALTGLDIGASISASLATPSPKKSKEFIDKASNTIDEKMHRIGDRMQKQVDKIFQFSTLNNPDIHSSILGVQVRNTAATMNDQLKDGHIEAALSAFVADCIPCAERMLSGFQFNIAGNFQATIENDLARRRAYLKQAFNFSTNKEVYSDLCSIINTLNFMCIPDLVRILSLLAFLLSKYSLNLKDLINVLQGLVSAIFKPLMINIGALLDQYAKLILDVMNCIIDAVQAQLAKLGKIGDADKTSKQLEDFQKGIKKNLDSDLEVDIVAAIDSGLGILLGLLKEGQDSMRALLDKWIEQLDAFLGDSFGKNAVGIGFLGSKLKIIRMMSLVRTIIEFKQSELSCPEENFSAEHLSVFVNNMNRSLTSPTGFSISVDTDGNTVSVSDENAELVNNVIGALVDIGAFDTTVAIPAAVAEEVDKLEQAVEQKLSTPELATTVTISLDDCLYGKQGANSDKVKQWIAELNNA